MARYFLDTSALVKHYHTEVGTPKVRAILDEPGGECLISRLAVVEMLSAFVSKVRIGAFSIGGFYRLRGQFLADVKQRMFRPVRLLNADFQLACDLVGMHGPSRQLRTLDALQLAVALRVHRVKPIDHFVCADQRLCGIAAAEGLAVIDPERPGE
jgi:predicted nucleic acid-binding protein